MSRASNAVPISRARRRAEGKGEGAEGSAGLPRAGGLHELRLHHDAVLRPRTACGRASDVRASWQARARRCGDGTQSGSAPVAPSQTPWGGCHAPGSAQDRREICRTKAHLACSASARRTPPPVGQAVVALCASQRTCYTLFIIVSASSCGGDLFIKIAAIFLRSDQADIWLP